LVEKAKRRGSFKTLDGIHWLLVEEKTSNHFCFGRTLVNYDFYFSSDGFNVFRVGREKIKQRNERRKGMKKIEKFPDAARFMNK